MALSSEESIFDSPAVALLCELEEAALDAGTVLTATLTPAGRVRLAPESIFTPDRIARVHEHRAALSLLVRICDDGVNARRLAFAAQIAAVGTRPVLPALRLVVPLPGVDGACVSCGDTTDAPSWCARCQLAARLEIHGTIPVSWVPVSRVRRHEDGCQDGSTVLPRSTVLAKTGAFTGVSADSDGKDGQDGSNQQLYFKDSTPVEPVGA